MVQPTLTHSADNLLHLYRLVALQSAVEQGAWFIRWLPDLAFGYGFPLFVFYAPLAYYLTLLLTWLPGLSTVAALNLSFGLALLLSATAAFLLAAELLGPRAGLVAALAYLYAPFQLTNALFRGGLPAAWAMAAFPLAFWLFTRLIRADAPPAWPAALRTPLLPLSALALGAALLMHNTLSLLFMPLLLLYLALAIIILPPDAPARAKALARAAIALALGGGLAAFFLLPALVEKEFAQVERVIISPDFDFRYHFVSMSELLALPPPANTGLLNPAIPHTLGLAHAGLALLGLLAGLWRWRTERRPTWLLAMCFAALALAGALFLMLPASLAVWEALPLLAFAQFPHRLLGPASLAVALLAGLAVEALPRRAAFWLALGGITLLVGSAAPLLYPRYRTDTPPHPTVADMARYEQASGTIGTTSFGEYLPNWVRQPPREPSPAAGQLAPEHLPANTTISRVTTTLNRAELTVSAAAPHLLVFNLFYFPGWQAWLDDVPVTVSPFSERGLVAVGIPAGEHRLRLAFVETPLRRVANAISLASLALAALLLAVSLLPPRPRPATSSRPAGFTRRQLAALAALALLLLGGKLLLDRVSSPVRQVFNGETVAQAETSANVNFGNQITLRGYTLPQTALPPGQNINLTAYWQAQQPLAANYSALAQLVDAENNLYAAQDNLHPGGVPTSSWPPWAFVQDTHAVPVPPGTPPGDYFVVTGLYHPETWARLPLLAGGLPGWADVFAVPVSVLPPTAPPTLAELAIQWPVAAEVGSLRLLGATPLVDALVPGDFFRVALFWEALAAPLPDYQVSLRLVDGAGAVLAERTARPSHNRYPTPGWAAGERVRDNHGLFIPPDAPAGVYRLQLQLLDAAGAPLSGWLALGETKN
ncbi:MAG: hypothetical protein Kow0031_29180 [Anaerolineae bacterium]